MVFGSVLEANLGSKTDKMASKIEIKKKIETCSENMPGRMLFLELPDGMRGAPGGI